MPSPEALALAEKALGHVHSSWCISRSALPINADKPCDCLHRDNVLAVAALVDAADKREGVLLEALVEALCVADFHPNRRTHHNVRQILRAALAESGGESDDSP